MWKATTFVILVALSLTLLLWRYSALELLPVVAASRCETAPSDHQAQPAEAPVAATGMLAEAAPAPAPGYVAKTVFSAKMRLIFIAGLEGAGHHYLNEVFTTCSKRSRVCRSACRVHDALYAGAALARAPSAYADAVKKLRHELSVLAQEEGSQKQGARVVLTNCHESCGEEWTLSFPQNLGNDRTVHHVNMRLLAGLCEEAGIDLRVLYLHRQAESLVKSTTVNRKFASAISEVHSLLHNTDVMSRMFTQMDRRFVYCVNYAQIAEKAGNVSSFLDPLAGHSDRNELAGFIRTSWRQKRPNNPTKFLAGEREKREEEFAELHADQSRYGLLHELDLATQLLVAQHCGPELSMTPARKSL